MEYGGFYGKGVKTGKGPGVETFAVGYVYIVDKHGQ